MQESIKITAVLTLVCVLCALSLSWIYGVAEERIELNAKQRIEKAIAILSPEAKEVVLGDYTDGAVYKLSDKEGKLIGYAFLAEGQGYQSTIKMLAVVDPSLKRLEGIEVIESVETPGLGAKIQEDSFKNQFKRLSLWEPIECVKEKPSRDNQITAITGATVSSRAVVNILNKKIAELRQKIK